MEKLALVTGVSRESGLGLATAKQLSTLGFNVIITARSLPKAGQLAIGSNFIVRQLDVTDDKSIDTLANTIDQEFGKLDVLINNAGAYFDQGGISLESIAKILFFNDRAPLNIAPPEDVTFSNPLPSSVFVSWKDRSNNESGFEIWRKQLNGQDSLWSMVALTESNTTSFHDTRLSPSSQYEYMIRGVSNNGRSPYTTISKIITASDNESPTTPTGLVAEVIGVERLLLRWNASADNSAIGEYWIFTGNDTIKIASPDTSFVFEDFEINSNYTFYVKAVDAGLNLSEASNKAEIFTKISGLFYEHSTGDWNSLEEIDWSIAEFTGTIDRFSLSPKPQEDFF